MTDTSTTTAHPDYRAGTWRLDPTHSELSFTVKHLAISKVRGFFRVFDATITAPEDPSGITVEATVDVASVDTNQEARDQHLRTSDFFLVDQHPTMTFRSTSVEVSGDDLVVHGELTLRGVTRPVTLTGEFGGIVVDGYGNTKAGVTATTTIDRHEFGVSWNAALEAGGLTLGDDVKISLDLQFALQS